MQSTSAAIDLLDPFAASQGAAAGMGAVSGAGASASGLLGNAGDEASPDGGQFGDALAAAMAAALSVQPVVQTSPQVVAKGQDEASDFAAVAQAKTSAPAFAPISLAPQVTAATDASTLGQATAAVQPTDGVAEVTDGEVAAPFTPKPLGAAALAEAPQQPDSSGVLSRDTIARDSVSTAPLFTDTVTREAVVTDPVARDTAQFGTGNASAAAMSVPPSPVATPAPSGVTEVQPAAAAPSTEAPLVVAEDAKPGQAAPDHVSPGAPRPSQAAQPVIAAASPVQTVALPLQAAPSALPATASAQPEPSPSAEPAQAGETVTAAAMIAPGAAAKPATGPEGAARPNKAKTGAVSAEARNVAPAAPVDAQVKPEPALAAKAVDDLPLAEIDDASTPAEPDPERPGLAAVSPASVEQRTVHSPAAEAPRATPQTVALLAAQIAGKVEGKSTRFDVQLDPHGLGKVDVRVEISARGDVSAALTFENPQAASELRGKAGELQTALEQAGFDLSKTSLSFNSSGQGQHQSLFDQQQQQNQTSVWRGRAFTDLSDTPETAPAPVMRRAATGGVDVRI